MSGHTTIPAAVRKQDEAADAAIAALEAARSDEARIDGSVVSEEPAAGSAATRDTLMDESNQQATPPAEGGQGISQAPVTKPGEGETVSREEFQKLKSRLDVLLGKYNSEVPRYAARVKELEQENDALNDRIEKAQKAPAEPSKDAYLKYLSEEERANLDEGYADIQVKMARGIAEEIAESRVQTLGDQIKQLKQTIADLRSAQVDDSTARFWRDVDALAPGAAQANASDDPEWVAFLGGIDPTSRLSYREIGIAAVNRGDSEAVANLFNLFRSTDAGEPKPPRRTAAAQVKPATAPSAPRTQSQPAGRIIKESEIKAFYQNAATSGLSEREIVLREAEFDKAAAEGRIRFGM